ncbi:MAG TPA: helix-turn-helix transcriptional regulator [Vulgatibacter sp.]
MFDSSQFRSDLGSRIRELRQQEGVTQLELADRAGISNEFLSKIEHGSGTPSLETIGRLAAGLGISVCDFFPPGRPGANDLPDRFLRLFASLDDEDRLLLTRIAEQIAKTRKEREAR